MTGARQNRLRALKPEDLESVIEIDRRITGRVRRGFFEKRLEAAQSGADTFIVLATEENGTLTGYAIARFEGGEFGDERPVAILDSVGVDPDRQHAGLGALLMDGIARAMRKLGVRELRTQVNWTDQALIRFFAANGFTVTPRIVLERPAGQPMDA